jgi:hypothetical protein
MPVHLPFVSLQVGAKAAKESVTRRWLQAVGERHGFPLWKNAGRRKHMWLHDLARKVDGYESAYEELSADALLEKELHSVEHVVPRSRIDDDSGAESDPRAWVQATRRANAQRSNLPLKLWADVPGEYRADDLFEVIDGDVHYLPPPDQRARLSRKWLFLHATYPHDIDAPSPAQLRNLGKIVALARDTPVYAWEQDVANALHDLLGLTNPLLTHDANFFYDELDWYTLLGGDDRDP